MTTALAVAEGIRWKMNSRGVSPLVLDYAEGTSETFLKGALVFYDKSEDAIVEVANSSGDPTADTFLGIAQADASGTAGTLIPVLIPSFDDVFSTLVASAQDTAVAPDEDYVGLATSFLKMDSANNYAWALKSTLTGTAHAVIIGFDPQDMARRSLGDGVMPGAITGTAGDRMLFKFFYSALNATGQQE